MFALTIDGIPTEFRRTDPISISPYVIEFEGKISSFGIYTCLISLVKYLEAPEIYSGPCS